MSLSLTDNEPPVTHTGYLKKQGQLHKNWKRRYFVVELGRLTYFEKSNGTMDPPYGLNPKGVLILDGYDVENGMNENSLRLTHKNEKRELLVEAENGQQEIEEWRAILEVHIRFCDQNPGLILQDGASFQEDEAKRAAAALKFRSIADAMDTNEEDEEDKALMLSAPKPIQLNPGFVIKTKRMNGLKVFLNVCDHDDIPQSDKKRGNKKWPIIVLGPNCKTSVDKNADECQVLDICVHSSVMAECQSDASGEAKEEVCMKVLDAIILREKKDKVESLIDKSVFSFPRLAKKYKGDTIPNFVLPRNINILTRSTSTLTAIDIEDHMNDSNAYKEEEILSNAKEIDIDETEPQMSVSGAAKKYILLKVVRQTGSVIRSQPDKAAKKIKTLLKNTETYCYGRRISKDGTCWYRVLEGWTPALTDGGQRMLQPAKIKEVPSAISFVGFNIIEAEEKGFFFNTTVKRVTFSVQFDYDSASADGLNKIMFLQRSYDDFLALCEDLRFENNLQEDVPFPAYGTEALKSPDVDVDTLLSLMEDMRQWFQRIQQGAGATCETMMKFLEPTEIDCRKMDVDLSASGGLGGAWPIEYN